MRKDGDSGLVDFKGRKTSKYVEGLGFQYAWNSLNQDAYDKASRDRWR